MARKAKPSVAETLVDLLHLHWIGQLSHPAVEPIQDRRFSH